MNLFAGHDWGDLGNHLPQPDAPPYLPPVHFPDIGKAKQICLDLETNDPDLSEKGPGVRRGAYIVGVGIHTDGFSEYYPLRHSVGPNCNPDHVMAWLRDQLRDFSGEMTGANVALYDGDFLQAAGVRMPKAKWRDVQWAEALIDEHADSYELNALAKKYLGETKRTDMLKYLYGEDYIKYFREVHPAHAREYVLGDVELPPRILAKQAEVLHKEKLTALFDMESRLTPFLLYLREHGVRVDVEKAEILSKELGVLRDQEVRKLNSEVGFEVDIYSSESLCAAFEKLKIRYPLTAKGNPSFRQLWLSQQKHPFAANLNRAREYDKVKETFVEGYILNGHINGRIYCELHPLRRVDEEEGERGTVSGRLSCSHPNLQNVPVRTDLGKKIRELFLPEQGMAWCSEDYSQIEFRALVSFAVAAKCETAEVAQKMYCDDPNTDFHQMVADLTGLDRKPAKNLNFGLVYGMGLKKLAASLGVPDEQAEEIMATYHARAPFIKKIYELCDQRAQRRGFITTILGRRARFPLWEPSKREWGKHYDPLPEEEAREKYGHIRRYKTHKALNSLLQGSAADLMKKAMVDLWESGLIGKDLMVHLSVHDEIDMSIQLGPEGERVAKRVQEIMENALKLHVPVRAEYGIGANWREAH